VKSEKTKRPRKSKAPKSHDDYLATVRDARKRGALKALRKSIATSAPKAEECISYGLPAFRLNGKFLLAYGAAANHCAFYPGSTLTHFKKELKDYDTSKGTIRFSADKPLPSTLVRKLVLRRIQQG
jgi:uncharacterized protein YdhG (YjbR/CyaY superfamily)